MVQEFENSKNLKISIKQQGVELIKQTSNSQNFTENLCQKDNSKQKSIFVNIHEIIGSLSLRLNPNKTEFNMKEFPTFEKFIKNISLTNIQNFHDHLSLNSPCLSSSNHICQNANNILQDKHKTKEFWKKEVSMEKQEDLKSIKSIEFNIELNNFLDALQHSPVSICVPRIMTSHDKQITSFINLKTILKLINIANSRKQTIDLKIREHNKFKQRSQVHHF